MDKVGLLVPRLTGAAAGLGNAAREETPPTGITPCGLIKPPIFDTMPPAGLVTNGMPGLMAGLGAIPVVIGYVPIGRTTPIPDATWLVAGGMGAPPHGLRLCRLLT